MHGFPWNGTFAAMNRRTVLSWLFAVLAVALPGLCAPVAAQEPVKLTFLHTNDNYEIVATRGWGGFAQLATLLKQERAASPNTVTTFGGDTLSPSIMSGFHKGAQMIALMNEAGVDLAVPGNHEFDFGPDVFAQRARESKFPWVASNMTRNGKLFDNTVETLVKTMGGVKVGFFGLVTPETARSSSPGPSVAFAPWKASAERAVKALKDQGAEVIVALTHLDFAEDRELANAVPGISLILGGHDHEAMFLLEGSTLIFKAGADARHLGVIDLYVSRRPGAAPGSPALDVWQGLTLIPVTRIEPDAEVAAIVKRYSDELDRELAVEIGTTVKPLDSRRLTVREREAAIGDLIADSLRDAFKADVGLMNGGGIRGDRQYPAGARITRRDVLTELPFGNIAVLIELKGADLLAALENGVSRVADRGGRFPQVSGLRFAYDPTKPAGQRVLEATVGGQKLDPERSYKVATIDFLLSGGDGYSMLANGRKLVDAENGPLAAQVLMDYVTKLKTIDIAPEGRIEVRK